MKIATILFALIFSTVFASSVQAGAKRYEIKSGIVTYNIEGGGSMLGFSTKTTGTEKLYFTDWGNLELREASEKNVAMGKTTLTHQITKIDHGTIYSVDDKEKVILKQDIGMFKEMDQQGKNMSAMGKDMMKQMGGKKTGTGKVLGYPCEIWEVMGTKTWIYKGVPLKTEANIMGFKHLKIATSAKFDVSVPKSKFALPDYPVKTLEQLEQMYEEMAEQEEAEESQKSAPKQHQAQPQHQPQPQQPQVSPEQMQQMQDMLQNLGKMFGGAK